MSAFLVSVCASMPSAVGRDTDRRRGVTLVAAKLQRLTEGRQQLACNALDIAALSGFLQDDDEFVTAEPRHHVAGAQRSAQAMSHLHQQHVAGLMAKRVVDDLETIEVDEEQREFSLVALRVLDGVA